MAKYKVSLYYCLQTPKPGTHTPVAGLGTFLFYKAYYIFSRATSAMESISLINKHDAPAAAVKKAATISTGNTDEEANEPGEIIGKPFTKIGLRTSTGTIYIALDNIIRLESSDNYTHIHTGNGGKYLITKTLKSFELILPQSKFIRCHQSHMVNLSHIEAYDKAEGSNLIMCNEHVVPVSRANRSRLEQVLSRMYPHI